MGSPSPTPIPHSPQLSYSIGPPRRNLSKSIPFSQTAASSTQQPAVSPSPKISSSNIPPPPLTPAASFSVRYLSPTSYSNQLVEAVKKAEEAEKKVELFTGAEEKNSEK